MVDVERERQRRAGQLLKARNNETTLPLRALNSLPPMLGSLEI